MHELLELLKDGKTKEALKGFQRLYKTTNDIIALYYVVAIECTYGYDSSIEELKKNFEILYNYDKEMKMNIMEFYVPFLLDIEEYKECLKITKEAFKLHLDSPLYYFAYAKCLVQEAHYKKHNKNILNKAIDYSYKCLESYELDEYKKELVYANLIAAYILKEEYNTAYELINKLYVTLPNASFIDKLKLNVSFNENNKEIINQMDNEISPNENNANIFLAISEYYLDNKYYDEMIKINEKIKPYLDDKTIATKNIAIAYLYKGENDKVIDLLNKETLTDLYAHNVLLGDAYFYKHDKMSLLTSINLYKKALEIAPENKGKVLQYIADCYCDMSKPDELKEIIKELKKINYMNLANYYAAYYYRLTKQFDEAEKLIKLIKNDDVADYKIKSLISNCYKNPEILNKYENEVFNSDDTYSLRDCLLYTMLGDYGNKIDMDKASEYAKKLEAKKDLHTCAYSTLSNYYLLTKDYKKSYELALIGYNKYLNGEEACECCAAYVAYHKLYGLGCEKNVKEAYKICIDTERRQLGDINENLGSVYATCCIELNLNLTHIYELLIRTVYRRYSIERYSMIIRVGKLLNKDVSYYEKMFKESLKHCSLREKEFYLKETNKFFMNNY